MKRTIWWIRRDLRLIDNQALNSALEDSDEVLAVFVLDPELLTSLYVGEKRMAFLLAGLRALDEALRQRGSFLVVRQGVPMDELRRLLETSGAQKIYAELDYSPYARQRDNRIASQLPIQWTGGLVLHPPGTILKGSGEPYTVFTPFSKAWKALPYPFLGMVFKAPEVIPTPSGIESLPIPDTPILTPSVCFPASEAEAQRRLERFTSTPSDDVDPSVPPIGRYAYNRDRMDLEGTSGLSPYLRFGMLSIRQAVVAALQVIDNAPDFETRQGAETWLNELIWREFYIHILFHFPLVRRENFRSLFVRWQNQEVDFTAWCQGQTGYPIVDAAMRQLAQSGWMHNRARMIVASFLTKDLLIDWRWGARWFMQHLIDGDPAANNGGWQWAAGTGTDAAPYFRIFNPISQSVKNDPRGEYIRRWLPELLTVPDEFVHQPWQMPVEMQKAVGCVIGEHYPALMLDHAWARERALRAYRK